MMNNIMFDNIMIIIFVLIYVIIITLTICIFKNISNKKTKEECFQDDNDQMEYLKNINKKK